MRKKIYQMVHVYSGKASSVLYKYLMILLIVVSIVPLTMKQRPSGLMVLECVCLFFFLIDYILRWSTADYKFENHSWKAFAKYPLRMISIIDLLSIFALASSIFSWFSILKTPATLSVFRIVRILRYSKNVHTILDILHRSKKALLAVGGLAVGYILVSAIVIFNVEPDSFKTFFDAVYWSTISLTTVGYGDIYPVTTLGRTIAMVSSFFGIAIVALPAGIVTAEYLNSIKE